MATTSPLSSPSSGNDSFYTAANHSAGGGSTTASSPVHARPCPYRAARQLPSELKQHCQIFLEEQLCTRCMTVSFWSHS